jgi:hypothetical protein
MTTPPLTDIGKFYKQVDDFKDKLIVILCQFEKRDEIVDLHKYHDKLILLKKANVRKPIELLYQYGIREYAEKILTRDEQFFLGKVSTIETTESESLEQPDLLFISQIRQVWEHLQPAVRKNIWDYIQVICILSERVVGGDILACKRESLRQEGRI